MAVGGVVVQVCVAVDEFGEACRKAAIQLEYFAACLKHRPKRNGPARLCIDGREYHRRQRNRAKRGRK